MATRNRSLGVWLNGIRIGDIEPRKRGYAVSLRYNNEAFERWPGNTPVLSCSLPLVRGPLDATNFFRGVLPEGNQLNFLASMAKTSTIDVYGLLARYGRDITGAVVIADESPSSSPGDQIPYDDATLTAEVLALDERPLAIHDDSELSLPGLQNKLLLIKTPTGWARPVGGRPSTHLLKVEDRRFPGLATMEHHIMELAFRSHLTTATTEVVNIGDIPCLIVSRFDRHLDGDGNVARIHQEDLCQALDINVSAREGRAKYESYGGPSFRDIAVLLDRYAHDPQRDLVQLVRTMAFTVLTGNGDAHGKNLSLMHDQPGQISLAPLYDTVPTMMWPTLPDRAAMHVNHIPVLSRIGLNSMMTEVSRWPSFGTDAQSLIVELAGELRAQLESIPENLAEAIENRIRLVLSNV